MVNSVRSELVLDSELSGRALSASAGKLLWDVSARSLGLILSVVVARALGTEGYGGYAVAWYVAWMLAQLTDLALKLFQKRQNLRLNRHVETRYDLIGDDE